MPAMSTDELNAVLLASIKDRGPRGTYGIRSAADYVGGVLECMFKGGDSCLPPGFNGIETLKAAEERLTYCNEETVCEGNLFTSEASIGECCKQAGIEAPPLTLMVFENIITTPKKDRDGDILRTDGAKVDPSMPLLWHHMLPMPVGKMLKVIEHNAKRLKVLTAVIDSPLGRDVAELIEFGALRISHGFLPTEMKRLPGEADGNAEYPGWDIQKFEIMEHSVVTVPSNTDAVITAFSQGKLTDPVAKTWAQQFYDERAKVFPVGSQESSTADTDAIPATSSGDTSEDKAKSVASDTELSELTTIDNTVATDTKCVEDKADDTEKPKAQPLTVEEYGRLFVCGMFLSPGGETEKHVDEMIKVCHVWKAKRKKAKRREAVKRVVSKFRR